MIRVKITDEPIQPVWTELNYDLSVNYYSRVGREKDIYPVITYGLSLFKEIIIGSITFRTPTLTVHKDLIHDTFNLDGRILGIVYLEFEHFELTYNPILLYYTPMSNKRVSKSVTVENRINSKPDDPELGEVFSIEPERDTLEVEEF